MKIAIGSNIKNSPFGGGNQFATNLRANLAQQGHQVFDHLNRSDIDVILMTEPRKWLQSCAFGPIQIALYQRNVNPNAIVVHRVNECDERKNTRTVNAQLTLANSVADHTVYVGSWLVDLFAERNFTKSFSVIVSGADRKIFPFSQKHLPTAGEKIRLVTHHWSAHWMKGWDIYTDLDKRLGVNSPFEFHYIGNRPKDIETKHIIFHKPCHGDALARKLAKNHIYLTGSMNDPGPMHPVEGMSVGLPVIFRDSGALPEYCSEYGIIFHDMATLWNALTEMRQDYIRYSESMAGFSQNAELMTKQYLDLFNMLINKKETVYGARQRHNSLVHRAKFATNYYQYYIFNRVGFQ